jgi:NAD(P)-dependent dehydrogenase (short-subunit alcohol dehydrogenase family)
VTGGNSGIGFATAKLFAKEGAKVVIVGRDRITLSEAASAIDGDVLVLQTDVTNLEEIDRLYQATAEKFGKIDILYQFTF